MAVAHVQTSAEAYGLEVSSFAPSLTSVTAGNLVTCVISYVPSATTNTACPTPTTSWSVAEAPTSTFGTAYAPRAAIFYKQNAGSGTQTATFSVPAGSYIGGQISEFSGVSTTAALDVHSNTIGTHASTGSATTGTSTVADSVVIATGCANAISISTPPTTGYTAIGYDDGSNIPYSPGYKVVAATGTQSATWTWTASGETDENYALVIAVFKADAGGGGGTNLTPGAASIAITGPAPTVARTENQSLVPGAASLTITGQAPTVGRTAHVSITPGAGALSLTGYEPSVVRTDGLNLTPAAASIALSGFAPTVAQSANQSLTPGAGSIGITGYAPAVDRTAHQALIPGAGSLVLAGYAPSVVQSTGTTLLPGAASLSITGFSPVVTQSAHVALSPGPAGISLLGYAPTVVNSGVEPAPTGSMGFEMGGKPAPRRVRYASIKPMLQAALESRLPEPETEDLAEPQAANAVTAGIVALQSEQLTPQLVERLAKQWRPAVTLAPNTTRQDAQLLYLRAVLTQKQAQEAQEAAIQRAKARTDDEQAIAMALRLLF